MTIESIMKAVMQQFSHGEQVYLRVITETGGDSDLGIRGEVTYEDFVPDTIPKVQRLTREEALSGDEALGNIRVLVLFGGDVTETVARQAAGVVIGGTYDGTKGQVTGGKFCPILKDTITWLYLDDNTPSGLEFTCGFEGGS